MGASNRLDLNLQGPHFRGALPSGALPSPPSPPLVQHFRSVTEFLTALTAYAVAHLRLTPSDIPNGDSLGFPSTCGEIRNGANTSLTPRSPATPPQPLPLPRPAAASSRNPARGRFTRHPVPCQCERPGLSGRRQAGPRPRHRCHRPRTRRPRPVAPLVLPKKRLASFSKRHALANAELGMTY